MNKNEKNSIKKYDSIASYYDSTYEGKYTVRFKEKTLEFCEVVYNDKVLDVGCGNGSLLYSICQKGDIEAYGIDISPKMIEECHRRYDGISFKVSSGEKLDFPDNYLDMITICCALHHLHNPKNFFAEARRVLKQDGILLVSEPWQPFPIKQLMDYVLSPLLRAGDNILFSRTRLKRLFADHGFVIISSYEKEFMQIIRAKKTCAN